MLCVVKVIGPLWFSLGPYSRVWFSGVASISASALGPAHFSAYAVAVLTPDLESDPLTWYPCVGYLCVPKKTLLWMAIPGYHKTLDHNVPILHLNLPKTKGNLKSGLQWGAYFTKDVIICLIFVQLSLWISLGTNKEVFFFFSFRS